MVDGARAGRRVDWLTSHSSGGCCCWCCSWAVLGGASSDRRDRLAQSSVELRQSKVDDGFCLAAALAATQQRPQAQAARGRSTQHAGRAASSRSAAAGRNAAEPENEEVDTCGPCTPIYLPDSETPPRTCLSLCCCKAREARGAWGHPSLLAQTAKGEVVTVPAAPPPPTTTRTIAARPHRISAARLPLLPRCHAGRPPEVTSGGALLQLQLPVRVRACERHAKNLCAASSACRRASYPYSTTHVPTPLQPALDQP
ncbi:hypothetical protein B0J12DRAFT_230628 [Macrophomina phaseolina]|uniref:Uncharacterized protein n=1 Tax=Macrophomina phaseolina TaxID=35725 RepID=A0ABQ8GPU8_9PEZI|nr:hypothetical protein B0J12DRAFT_230628 [Macrophomina phaseolina]